ncbi:hypothetical protein [Prochlorothrix hollandica]|uniref:hypothetical protein n=1 Tax=Prochlorothrix hollandica TaxID=1223 RepID=UPI003342DB40
MSLPTRTLRPVVPTSGRYLFESSVRLDRSVGRNGDRSVGRNGDRSDHCHDERNTGRSVVPNGDRHSSARSPQPQTTRPGYSSRWVHRSSLWGLLLTLGSTVGSLGLTPAPAAAHGASIDYTVESQIHLQARYDSGEPMAQAAVVIYSPQNPTEPWQTLTTDDQGQIQFTPDPSQPGEWAVKVRQAGHGNLITIVVGDGGGKEGEPTVALAQTPATGSLSPSQKVIILGSMVWGFVGTGLFFMRKS